MSVFRQLIDLQALLYAAMMVGTLTASTLVTCAYISYKDLNGDWAGYKLYSKSTNTMKTYLQHLPSAFFGWFVIFALFTYFYGHFYKAWLFAPMGSLKWNIGIIDFVIAWYLNRFYGFFIHFQSHKRQRLYRLIHGRHHLALKNLCATANGQNTVFEFFLIDVLTYFGIGQLILPVPWQPQVLLCVWIGVMGAIDHSGFYVPRTIFDGRFHFLHHLDGRVNLGEFSFLDRWFGTYKKVDE